MSDILDSGSQYALARLRNAGSGGKDSAVFPKVFGEERMLLPTGFRVVQTASYFGGTEFIVAWQDLPFAVRSYKVYGRNTVDGTTQPVLLGEVAGSPCRVRVVTQTAATVVFSLAVVTTSGYETKLTSSCTCTGQTIAPTLGSLDVPDNTIPFDKLLMRVKVLTTTPAVWDAEFDYYRVDATAGNIVLTIPTTVARKNPIWIKKTDATANYVRVTAAATETVEGAATKDIIYQNTCIMLVPYSGNWGLS